MGKLMSKSGKEIEIDQTEEALKKFGLNVKPDQQFRCTGCGTHHDNPCKGIIKGVGKGGCTGQMDVIYMLLEGETGVTFCPIGSVLKDQFPLK